MNADDYYFQLDKQKDIFNLDYFPTALRNLMTKVDENDFSGRFNYAWKYFFHFTVTEQLAVFGNAAAPLIGYEMCGAWLNWYYGGHKSGQRLIFEEKMAQIHNKYAGQSIENCGQKIFKELTDYYKTLGGYLTDYLTTNMICTLPDEKIAEIVGGMAWNYFDYEPNFFANGRVSYPVMDWLEVDMR